MKDQRPSKEREAWSKLQAHAVPYWLPKPREPQTRWIPPGPSPYLLTCKLAVGSPPGSKFGHQLPVGLEDEHAARLVVDGDDVAVPVHGDALGAHQFTSANLILGWQETGEAFV